MQVSGPWRHLVFSLKIKPQIGFNTGGKGRSVEKLDEPFRIQVTDTR